MLKSLSLATLLAVLLFVAAGCSDDDKNRSGGPTTPPLDTRPSTPDELVDVFCAAFAGRDLAAYSDLLSADYRWIPTGGGDPWPYDDEVAVAEAMFGGLEGLNGYVISGITLLQFEPQGVWTTVLEDNPAFGDHPGSMVRSFLVDIQFAIAGRDLILRVQGSVVLCAVLELDGDTSFYRVLGLVDLTIGDRAASWPSAMELHPSVMNATKATENISWTGVKTFFL